MESNTSQIRYRVQITPSLFVGVQYNQQLSNGKILSASKYIAVQLQAFCIFYIEIYSIL